MNIFKLILASMDKTAQMIHEVQSGTFRGFRGPMGIDRYMVCKHCGQHVNDKNINHASTGCTVKILEK